MTSFDLWRTGFQTRFVNIMKEKAPVWYTPLGEKTIDRVKILVDHENLQKKSSLKILDFGCGNGRYMYLFKSLFPQAEIHGVDVNKDDVTALKEDFTHVYPIKPDYMDINYGENSFDLVHSSNVLEHIPRPLYLDYIETIQRILTPGGKFVFGTPNYPYKRIYDLKKALKQLLVKRSIHSFLYYLFDDPTHINKLNYKTLENDLALFAHVSLYPTTIAFSSIIRKKQLSDKIIGVATKQD